MKSRIKHIEGVGYFAQVKPFFFWYTIGAHTSGYGLYPNSYINNPVKKKESAEAVLKSYFSFTANLKKNSATYSEIKFYKKG